MALNMNYSRQLTSILFLIVSGDEVLLSMNLEQTPILFLEVQLWNTVDLLDSNFKQLSFHNTVPREVRKETTIILFFIPALLFSFGINSEKKTVSMQKWFGKIKLFKTKFLVECKHVCVCHLYQFFSLQFNFLGCCLLVQQESKYDIFWTWLRHNAGGSCFFKMDMPSKIHLNQPNLAD